MLLLSTDFSPLIATVDRLGQVSHACLNLTFDHIFNFDLVLAAVNDLIRDFHENSFHPLLSCIEARELPDHANFVKDFRQELRNIDRSGTRDLVAGLKQEVQESEVVLGLVIALDDLVRLFSELSQIAAVVASQDLGDLVQVWVTESIRQNLKVCGATLPIVDLIERCVDRLGARSILAADELLDLACPSDDDGLESLNKVTVFSISVGVTQVLLGNVEVSLTSLRVRVLMQESHELVHIGDELLLDSIRPVIVTEQCLQVVLLHLVQQVVERLLVDHAERNAVPQVSYGDLLTLRALDKAGNIVVVGFNSLA